DVTPHVIRERPAAQTAHIPIGRPIPNLRMYVLDRWLSPVPVGVAGELYVGGVGVGRGYRHDPGKTAEVFVPDPFSRPDEPGGGARLYKTGDRVRYRADGAIEFLGRIDYQVKLRGYRIELGEIEAALAQHSAVRESLVIVREDAPGRQQLVAYLTEEPRTKNLEPNGEQKNKETKEQRNKESTTVPPRLPQPRLKPAEVWGRGLGGEGLRAFLRERLPEYMVPAAFVVLDALPLTPNGKVDRRALPAPAFTGDETTAFVAPRTPTEELLAVIWADVLGVEKIGSRDRFFELGGHSLLATQVLARVRDAFDVELPLRTLFESVALADLAAEIDRARSQQPGDATALVPMPHAGQAPVSFEQQQLWLFDQLQPGTTIYNIAAAVRLQGPLSQPALRQAFDALVARHEVLRTSFRIVDGHPQQVIAPTLEADLSLVDLHDEPGDTHEDRTRELALDLIEQPFDLGRGPLLRAMLIVLEPEAAVLVIVLHHIVGDRWSLGLLIRDLGALYTAARTGEASLLRPLPIQYADYAHWQRTRLQDAVLESQLSYWRSQLANLPRLRIPADYPRPQQPTFRGGTISFTLSGEVSSALQQISQRTGVTLFMTLLSAFQVLLGRYAQQDDVVVGTSVANRHRTQLEDVIGFFVNTLVLRSNLAGDPTFQQLLARVRSVVLDAFTHQDLPFAALVEALQPQRNLSINPLFQVFFVLQTAPLEPLALPELEMTPLDLQGSTAMFDLLLSMEETEHGLRGALEYNSDLFESSTITRMIRRFGYLLEQIVQQSHAPISALDLDPALVLPPVAPATSEEHYLPLSPHQERLWFVDQFETGNVYAANPTYYNLPLILRLRGPIDQRALEHSLHAVVERHSALRTTIVGENAERRQAVRADAKLTLSMAECSSEAALERALDEARQPFALDGEPLLRATLLRVSADEALLVVVVHHIVADKSSLRLIAQELVAIYRARITGQSPQLPPVLLQYADYVAWQRTLPTDAIELLLFFWKRQLGGRVQALALPENRPRPTIHTFTAARQQFALPGDLLHRVRALSQEESWSEFALLLAGFKALLHRYARQSEIVVGTTVDARAQLGLEQTVGPIANLVVLRSQVSGDLTFRALLAQLNRTIEQALAHGALPFDRLVQELKPEQDMGRTALFDVLFQLDEPPPLLTTGTGIAAIVETNLGYGKYDLNLALTRGDDAITGSLVYNADIYDAWMIAQMVEHFQVLLAALVADRDWRIADVDLLSAAEVQQQRVTWNATDAQYPADLTVDQLFAAQVARTPANIAVRDGAEQITYQELDARANQLAYLLIQQGVGPDTLVALCFERSIEMIVALLAVLKAGGAYLPLEPSYPEDRLRFMVEDARVAHLVTTRDLLSRVPAPVAAVILIDEQRATIAAQPRTAPAAAAMPSNLMYCIYTSGSTGIPKGVLLEHRNVVRLVLNDRHPYAFGEHDVWSMFHSYCFDVSVWEMYGALLYGGTLVIVPAQVAKDPVAFVDLLVDHRVTILSQTPTAFSYVAKEVLKREQAALALRYVIFAGEALDPLQLQAWHERYPAVALINMYGITETTVHSTF
ncbi:MAG TPA: condensation domain-containing protein, partial [Herpetosiphonaceae bacterium]